METLREGRKRIAREKLEFWDRDEPIAFAFSRTFRSSKFWTREQKLPIRSRINPYKLWVLIRTLIKGIKTVVNSEKNVCESRNGSEMIALLFAMCGPSNSERTIKVNIFLKQMFSYDCVALSWDLDRRNWTSRREQSWFRMSKHVKIKRSSCKFWTIMILMQVSEYIISHSNTPQCHTVNWELNRKTKPVFGWKIEVEHAVISKITEFLLKLSNYQHSDARFKVVFSTDFVAPGVKFSIGTSSDKFKPVVVAQHQLECRPES